MTGAAYFRFQPNLGDDPPPLDASTPHAIEQLRKAAETFLGEMETKN